MNNSARRFLALNAVLHGHSFLEAFNNDIEMAAEVFSDSTPIKAAALEKLNKDLMEAALREAPKELDILTSTLLNFFRDGTYAFIGMPGKQPILIKSLAGSDMRKEIDDNLRQAVLMRVFRDVTHISDPLETRISDGVLYTVETSDRVIMQALLKAYFTWIYGPNETPKRLISVRDRLSLDTYKPIGGNITLNILKDIVKSPLPSTIYKRTCLSIIDMLEVWKATGCIMSLSKTNPGFVNILMDVKGDTEQCKIVSLDKTSIGSLMVNEFRDLQSLECDPSSKTHISVKENM